MLIQITQNLATRIRNSHAFNLPTFYLPRDDDCGIPNAIEDVCKEIDKSINQTVQKNLRTLKNDCKTIIARIDDVLAEDVVKRSDNMRAAMQGLLFYALASGVGLLIGLMVAMQLAPAFCGSFASSAACGAGVGAMLLRLQPGLSPHFNWLAGSLAVVLAGLLIAARMVMRLKPVFTKRDKQKLAEYKAYAKKIADLEKSLYDEYFKSLSLTDER